MVQPFILFGGDLPWYRSFASAMGAESRCEWVTLGVASGRAAVGAAGPSRAGPSASLWTYPRGFNGAFAFAFDRQIRGRLQKLYDEVVAETGETPFVMTSYPKFGRYLRDIDRSQVIYYNQDDSADYRENPNGIDNKYEVCLIESAGTVLCASVVQTARFQQRFPALRERIFHLPHGVSDDIVNPRPRILPDARTVVTIGSLSFRYDWRLVHAVVSELGDVRFRFIGGLPDDEIAGLGDWRQWREQVLRLANVEYHPLTDERADAALCWNSAVQWMPYDPALRFNEAACPLKLFTGLASGRPIVSSRIPECLQYGAWVQFYDEASGAVQMIRKALETVVADTSGTRAATQVAFARTNAWTVRARQVLNIVARASLT